MEASAHRGAGAVLDLNGVEAARRADVWTRAARTFFPGLKVELQSNPTLGSIQGMPFGSGSLWNVLSPPLFVSYSPTRFTPAAEPSFSIMLQLQGSTIAAQNQRTCRLEPHHLCMIDNSKRFELEVRGQPSHVMFLQIPRQIIVSRYPYLEHRTAETLDPRDGGTALLSEALQHVLEWAPSLGDEQRDSVLLAVVQLLSAARLPSSERSHDIHWRVRAALAFIDSNLGDTALTAERVARSQGISRRRLDEIFLETIGLSLTSQIWTRRLTQAAADLADRRCASASVTEIAFGVGFKSTAHFTRAFARRYHCTPCEWRRRRSEPRTTAARRIAENGAAAGSERPVSSYRLSCK
jgi:AraC-like DNA-binding protein